MTQFSTIVLFESSRGAPAAWATAETKKAGAAESENQNDNFFLQCISKYLLLRTGGATFFRTILIDARENPWLD
jgi:hypothetical protein